MRFDYFAYTMTRILRFFIFCILLPVGVALYYKEYESVLPFVYTFLIAIILTLGFKKVSKSVENLNDIKKIDGFGIVILGWLFMSLFCSLPSLLEQSS